MCGVICCQTKLRCDVTKVKGVSFVIKMAERLENHSDQERQPTMTAKQTISQVLAQLQSQSSHQPSTIMAGNVGSNIPGSFHAAISNNPLTALLREPVHVPSGYPVNMSSHFMGQQNPNKTTALPPPPPPAHPQDFGRHNLPRFPTPAPPPAHHHVPGSHHIMAARFAQSQKGSGFGGNNSIPGNLSQSTKSQQHTPAINMTTDKQRHQQTTVSEPVSVPSKPPKPAPPPKMVEIPNPFCMTPQIFPTRVSRLVRTEESHYNTRNGGCINPAKSLDLLRAVLQNSINKDIKKVMDKYRQYFDAAAHNVKENYGDKAVTEASIMSTFQEALEQAKDVFKSDETSSVASGKTEDDSKDHEPARKKFKALTEVNFPPLVRKRKGRPPREFAKPKTEPVKRDGPKWDPNRVDEDTLFVMGAKANKALGLGATRGRLYYKHPELFKYCGDQEDKQWLYENGLMPATGGKAFILIVEDILDLAETDEYKNNPDICLNEVRPFKVNAKIQEKMKAYIRANRTDGPGDS